MERNFLFQFNCSIVDIFSEINCRETFTSKNATICEFWRNGRWVLSARWDVTMAKIGSFLDGQFAVNINYQDCIEWKLDKKAKIQCWECHAGFTKASTGG